jgi:hypothetical protein
VRSSRQPRQGAGYIVSIALILIIMMALVTAITWIQRRAVQTQLLEAQLIARLDRELPREVERVYARARARGSVLDRRLAEAQAFVNLHTQGRRQMVALEREREQMKRLMAQRVDVHERLDRLSLEVRRAQMWVMMLESRLKTMPEVRPSPERGGRRQPVAARHTGAAAALT